MKFILASSSPRRKILITQLFKDLGYKRPRFTILHANIDESRLKGERPVTYARRLAKEKAICVAKKIAPKTTTSNYKLQTKNYCILAADTIVVLGNQIFGKPRNKKHAAWMLSRLSGRRHRVITAFYILVVSKTSDQRLATSDYETSTVFFHKLSKPQIQTYIESNEPHDKAGAYAIQGSKFSLVKKISGSYTNVVGLPVEKVKKILSRLLK